MITAFKQQVTVKSGGLVSLRSRRLKAGTKAEVIVLVEPEQTHTEKFMTGADLLESDLVGMWSQRKDIDDSLEFARQLRKKAENRDKEA
jgi:hypothetical protein